MKKYTGAFLLLISLMFQAQSQSITQQAWAWQNPKPQGNDLTDVAGIDGKFLWAVGQVGTIIHSADSGKTWTVQRTPTSAWLRSVFFITNQIGWATGENGTILKTTNAGNTWLQQTSPNTTHFLNDVYFVDPQNGWIAGTNGYGIIMKTTNGGETWNITLDNSTGNFMSINFTSASEGWASGFAFNETYLTKTTDGGLTWTPQTIPSTYNAFRVQFADTQTGWLFLQFGEIFKTTNGGTSWQLIATQPGFYFGAHFADNNHGCLVGNFGRIHTTTNGGGSWINASGPADRSIQGVWMLSTQLLVAVGDAGTILQSTDGGQTWNSTTTEITKTIRASHFFNAQKGIAVGDRGQILKTTNGGNNWQIQVTDTNVQLNDIHFVNDQTGWIAGSKELNPGSLAGVLYKTTNGGDSWTAHDFGMFLPAAFRAIHFTDAQNGWAVGIGGNIHRTTNGGQNWEWVFNFITQDLYDIHFTSDTTGFVTGEGGYFISFTSSGSIGQAFSIAPPGVLGVRMEKFSFADANTGWAVGSGVPGPGVITHTTDGGLTSTPQYIGPAQLHSIHALSAEKAWAVGDSGRMFYTADGGTNWVPARRTTFNHLYTIAGTDTANLWAMGERGCILHTDFTLPTSVSGRTLTDLRVYPNPSRGRVQIQTNETILQTRLMDATGRQFPVPLHENQTLDLSGLSPGLYILQIQTPKGYQTSKLIKTL